MHNSRIVSDRLIRSALALALGLHLLLLAAAIQAGTVLQPFSDMYDLVARWLQYRSEGGLLAYLLDPHNFHRLAYTRALVALDMGALHGSGVVYLVVGVVALLVAAAVLARAAWIGTPPGGLRLPAAAVAAMLVLSSVNAIDVVFPIDTPYAHAFVLAVVAMSLWDGPWRWAALPVAALAAFGNAVALVLWPVLLFSAWRSRSGWRTPLLIAALGAGFIGLYAWGQTTPPRGAFDPLASLHYGLVWLGLPWSTRLGGPLIGLGLLAASLFLIATRGGAEAPRLERLAVRLILFSLGAAGMAVLGRSGFEPEVPVRYALFLTPLHLGVFFLALPWLEKRKPVLVVLIAVVLAQQAYGVLKVAGAAAQVRAALADFAAGRDTPMVRVFVHPEPEQARAVLVEMRRQTGRNTTFAQ